MRWPMSLLAPVTNVKRLAILLALTPAIASAGPTRGKVVGVMDGDTVEIIRTVNGRAKVTRIRLYGIDAPERRQPFSTQSKLLMSKLVFGKIVDVYPKATDRYGRVVASVYVNGKSVGISMVDSGMAWWYEQFAPHDGQLRSAQVAAKKRRQGIWSERTPTPPWDFRKAVRAK